jgi:stage II sporulation protein M
MAGTGAISLWNHYRELLWDGRRWVIAAVALFIGGTVSGYSAAISQPQMVIEAMTPLIQAVAQVGAQVVAASDPLTRTWVIFRMNAAAVTQFVALGVAGGVVPAINTFANGAMIGVVAAIGGNLAGGRVSPGVMVAGIAPHAVFELPALWLASAWGMKLGVSWLLPGASGRRMLEWRETASEAAYVLVLAAGLLVIAAAIEGNLSLALVQWLQE